MLGEDERLDAFLWFDWHDDVVEVGIGLRPDLTGRGLGESFMRAQLEYASQQWRLVMFRLFVAAWNDRASGFTSDSVFREVARETRHFELVGDHEFVRMERGVKVQPITDEQASEIAEVAVRIPVRVVRHVGRPAACRAVRRPRRRTHLRAVVDDDGELVGFFSFVPEGHEVRLGLGMRPDLTGRGLAQPFIAAGLEYARREWRRRTFRLWSRAGTSAH